VRQAIRTRHDSLRTEETYVQWIRRVILLHNKCHPKDMGAAEVAQFLSDLAVNHPVVASTQNQALSAILFLYQAVLKADIGWLDEVVRAKQPKKTAGCLDPGRGQSRVERPIRHNLDHGELLYGSGLRLMACLRVRVKDVDFSDNQVLVRDGKGAKDRVTMLPLNVNAPLQRHVQDVTQLHARDLPEGFGAVYVPYALEHKDPQANREWAWQDIFPAAKRSMDPRSGTEADGGDRAGAWLGGSSGHPW
jgi:site-specific recombinase XerD